MNRTSVVRAIFIAQCITAAVAFGQSDEFSRSSGGQIEATMKRPNMLSGSLGLGFSRSSLPFSTGLTKSLEGTFGGTLLKDRLWFFGSAQMNQGTRFQPVLASAPAIGIPAIGFGNMSGRIGDQQSFTASIDRGANFGVFPSSFLSLHYTGIISSNTSFTASVSRQSSVQPEFITLRPR